MTAISGSPPFYKIRSTLSIILQVLHSLGSVFQYHILGCTRKKLEYLSIFSVAVDVLKDGREGHFAVVGNGFHVELVNKPVV